MIVAEVNKNQQGVVYGFSVKNHGGSVVCAAVSMLVLNTVNSIEAFTEDDFNCEYDEEGGYLRFALTSESVSVGTATLLKALYLGLMSTQESYPDEISIKVNIQDTERYLPGIPNV